MKLERRTRERKVTGNSLSTGVFIVSVLVGVVLSLLFFPIPQKAQITFPLIVNTTSDTVVAGACQAGNPQPGCSLRGAILRANELATADLIIISVPASDPFCSAGVCTINLTQALPVIVEPVAINGPGADKLIVKPVTGGQFRVFYLSAPGESVTISGLTISNGVAVSGGSGGILNSGGTLNVINCTLIGNQASTVGGGIGNFGILNVTNSTITGNSATAPFSGGGIYNDFSKTLNITNSTISGNTGGGISGHGTFNVTNSTISGNQTASSSGGGGLQHDTGTAFVKNSIIVLNTSTTTGPDVNGNFVSAGFNLIGKRDGSTGFTAPTDQTGTIAALLNPMLDPKGLQNNGGTTRTITLLSGSPAIDKGSSSGSVRFKWRHSIAG